GSDAAWASPPARGSSILSTERASKVVVITKKMISTRITSISGTRLISGTSSARRSRMRIASVLPGGRGIGGDRRDRGGRAPGAGVDNVHELDRLVRNLDEVAIDAGAEPAMEHQRRHRDDHAGGGAHQRLADAAGQLVDVAHAVVHHPQEHLDHADHGAEQA